MLKPPYPVRAASPPGRDGLNGHFPRRRGTAPCEERLAASIIARVRAIRRFFFPPSVPVEYRSNFLHLYLDIGWFGILSGSSVNFLSVYATRLGATGFQIGLLGSAAAAVSLALAIPTGKWLETRDINMAVFRSSVWYRLGYLLWVPLPWLFGAEAQVWALIVIALLMAVPLTPVSVGFNALFAAAVPPAWRAHVAGVRNVAFAIAFMLSSLGSGYLLDRLPFPAGYQLIFGIGFLGAALSSLQLYFIRPIPTSGLSLPPRPQPASLKKALSPRQLLQTAVRFDIWRTPFRTTLLVFFGFHLAQYLAAPLFPLFQVRELGLADDQIGIGTALFYLTVLLGSTRLNALVRKFGHKNLTGISAAGPGPVRAVAGAFENPGPLLLDLHRGRPELRPADRLVRQLPARRDPGRRPAGPPGLVQRRPERLHPDRLAQRAAHRASRRPGGGPDRGRAAALPLRPGHPEVGVGFSGTSVS